MQFVRVCTTLTRQFMPKHPSL